MYEGRDLRALRGEYEPTRKLFAGEPSLAGELNFFEFPARSRVG